MENSAICQHFYSHIERGHFYSQSFWKTFPDSTFHRGLFLTGAAIYLVTHLGKKIALCRVEVHCRAMSSSGKWKIGGKRSLKPFLGLDCNTKVHLQLVFTVWEPGSENLWTDFLMHTLKIINKLKKNPTVTKTTKPLLCWCYNHPSQAALSPSFLGN